ncbi:MAG: MFS transporter [Nitrososphaerales archaeon]
MMKRTKLLVGMSVFWLGLALLMDGLNSVVLPIQLLHVGGARPAATTLGLVTFAGLLAALVIQPMAGEWSDRMRGVWGRTGAIAVALFGILAGLFALGLGQNLVSLFVAYLIIQAAASIGRAAMAAFIPDLLPYDKTGRADALRQGMLAAGSALGFLVLGSFLAAAALGPALMVIGAVLTIAFLLTVLLLGERPRVHGVRHSSPTWDDLYRFDFRTHRRYGWLVLSRGLFLVGVFAVSRFLLLFLVDRFGIDPSGAAEQSGLLLGGMVLVTVLFAPLAVTLAERLGHGFMMAVGALVSGAGIAALAFGGTTVYVLVGMLAIAFGSGAFLAANAALADDLIPAVDSTKFKGLANLASLAAAALAGLFGPLLDWGAAMSPGKGYVLLFAAATIALVIGTLAARQGLAAPAAIGETVTESSRS